VSVVRPNRFRKKTTSKGWTVWLTLRMTIHITAKATHASNIHAGPRAEVGRVIAEA